MSIDNRVTLTALASKRTHHERDEMSDWEQEAMNYIADTSEDERLIASARQAFADACERASYGENLSPTQRPVPSFDVGTAAYVADLRGRLARAGHGPEILVPELQALLTQYPESPNT